MTDAGEWVVRSGTARDTCRVRLVCFPHAGGGTSAYRPWIEALAPEVEVLPVVLPGRDSRYREPPATNLTELARAAAEGLCPVLLDEEHDPPDATPDLDDQAGTPPSTSPGPRRQPCAPPGFNNPPTTRPGPRQPPAAPPNLSHRPTTPYALFGHSLGAILAYETARALRGLAPPPALLIASASVPPHKAAEAIRSCHTLPDEEFLTEVVRLGGIPPAVLDEPELVRLMLPVLRADFTVAETYTHTPDAPLDCPLAVYTADADPSVSREGAAAWERFTDVRPVVHRSFPGDHFYLDGARPHLVGALRRDLLKEAP